jgi:hypothetical protein
MTSKTAIDPGLVVGDYLAVWSEPDPELRRNAIAALWAPGGTEFVEGTRFRGHSELEARIAGAYRQFVQTGEYTVTSAADATSHDNIVMFTIQLVSAKGDKADEVAWASRVFLVLGDDGLIYEDYQLTVKPLEPA